MRPLAVVPALCCAAALVLSFLCMFAGHKKDFMEDYHLITLNTSRIGYNLLNSTKSSSNTLANLIDEWENKFSSEINDLAGDIAQTLGIDDFYSVHMLDYCYGDYTPAPVANATVKSSSIHKNVTKCTNGNQSVPFHFDPEEILQQKLNQSGVGITLSDLDWPDDIDSALSALHAVETAMFVLYCIAIALIGISFLAGLPAVFAAGRLAACLNMMMASLAFLAIGLASALVTAVIVKGTDAINKYGKEIGLEAHKGTKFLALTWAATALMLIATVLWTVEICFGGHRRRKDTYVAKHG